MNDSSENFEGQMILRAGDDSAHLPTIPTPVLEALYNTVTRTKETAFSSFRSPKIITLDDIEQLTHLFNQWSVPYNTVFSNITFTIVRSSSDKLKASYRTSYQSIEDLKRGEPGRTDAITSVQISYSALMRNIDTSKLDNIELTVDLNGVVPQYLHDASEEDPLGESYSFSRFDHDDSSLSTLIKYNNYVVAKGCVNLVEEWYSNTSSAEIWCPSTPIALFSRESIYEPGTYGNIIWTLIPVVLSTPIVFGILRKHVDLNLAEPLDAMKFGLLWWALYTAFDQSIRICSRALGGEVLQR